MKRWLSERVRPFCKGLGMEVLRDDWKFIEKKLAPFSHADRRVIMHNYINVWRSTRKHSENYARRQANLYLLHINENYSR